LRGLHDLWVTRAHPGRSHVNRGARLTYLG
jgi:hypothetical protein